MQFTITITAEQDGEKITGESKIPVSENFMKVLQDLQTSAVSDETKQILRGVLGQELFTKLTARTEESFPQLAYPIEELVGKL